MSDTEVLLSKADALLLRLRSSADADFPVLTEIVEIPSHRDRHEEPHREPLHSTSVNGIDIDELYRRLHMQLAQSLEHTLNQWASEILQAKLRQELERVLQHSLERAMEQSRDEMNRRIGERLLDAIDAEIRARLPLRD